MDGMEWKKNEMKIYEQVLLRKKKVDEIMIKHEWVKTFHEEDDRKRWWTNEMNDPLKLCELNF